MYADAFPARKLKEIPKIWQGRLEEARQFIKSVEQRQNHIAKRFRTHC